MFSQSQQTDEPEAVRLAELKADIDRGMADVTKGRLTDFDPESIIALGKKSSVERAGSVSPIKRK